MISEGSNSYYFVIRMIFRTVDKKFERLDLNKKLDMSDEARNILKKHFGPQNDKTERMECK